METLYEYLERVKVEGEKYLDEIKQHKLKMISPKVQGQVMATAGVIAFIDETQKRLKEGVIKV